MVLTTLCSTLASAQALEDGEAFYIYCNDGDFHGFFYDEVLDMRYSRIDLKGEEHDEHVVQEIVTADSVYRIPICTIDSISFVQPPIELNPDLRYMDELGMNQYLIRADELESGEYYMALDASIPKDLIPKVGEIVLSTSGQLTNSKNIHYTGFAFRTTKVVDKGWMLQVYGEELQSIGEVFQQFITTEGITANERAHVRRRLAGAKSITRAAADGSLNLLNLSGTLTREFKEGEYANLAITVDYGVKVGISVSYDITVDHLFVKLGMTENLSAQAGFSGTLQGTWNPDFSLLPDWIGAIKFPACLPLFETNALPKTFFRIQGTVGIKSTLPSVNYKGQQLIIISDRTGNWINARSTDNFFSGYGEKDNLFQPGDSRLTLSGFVQSGVKFDNTIKTNSWARNLFQSSIGLETYVGPKLTGAIDVSLPDLMKGDLGYGLLSGMYVSFSPGTADVEATARVNFLGYPPQSTKFAEGSYSFGETKLYILPQHIDLGMEYDTKSPRFNLKLDGDVLFANNASIVIYKRDGNKEEVCRSSNLYHFRKKDSLDFKPVLPPGMYTASVVVNVLDKEVRASTWQIDKEFDIVPELHLSDTKVNLPDRGEDMESPIVKVITYSTDAPVNVFITKTEGTLFGSATCKLDTVAKTITITALPNNNLCYYNGQITVEWCIPGSYWRNQATIDLHQELNSHISSIKCLTRVNAHRKAYEYWAVDGEKASESEVDAPYFGEFDLPVTVPVTVTRTDDKFTLTGTVTGVHDELLGTVNADFLLVVEAEDGMAYVERCEWNCTYDYLSEKKAERGDHIDYEKAHGDMAFATEWPTTAAWEGYLRPVFGNRFGFKIRECTKFESTSQVEKEYSTWHMEKEEIEEGWFKDVMHFNTHYTKTIETLYDFYDSGTVYIVFQ